MARNPEMGGGRARSGSKERGIQGTGDRRPRTEDRGFLGNDDDSPDPVAPRGLLAEVEEFLDQPQSPSPALRERRSAEVVRREGDDQPSLLRPAPVAEEEEIIPGDPSDFGARGRRRRSRDDSSASPVLRRGLLGV